MKKLLLLSCLMIVLTSQMYAQSLLVAKVINEDTQPLIKKTHFDEFRGFYHIINSKKSLPIDKLMKESNYCEIENDDMLIRNCATEMFDDGTVPNDEISIEKISPLLRLDVLEYDDLLRQEHNTPLKLKRFMESGEYSHHRDLLKLDRDCFLGNTYYAIREITDEEEKTFDLDNGCFRMQLPWALRAFDCRDISLETSDTHFGEDKFVTPKIDEDTAYKIESNPCGLFVWVKFNGKTRKVGAWMPAICEPLRVCIVNMNTGEIYFEYMPVKDIPNPTNEEKVAERPSEPQSNEEKNAVFKDGDNGIYKHISENIKVCKHCEKDGLRIKIIVYCEILPDCSIKVLSFNRTTGCDTQDRYIKEAVESIEVISPATLNGKPVKTSYRIPINLYL